MVNKDREVGLKTRREAEMAVLKTAGVARGAGDGLMGPILHEERRER